MTDAALLLPPPDDHDPSGPSPSGRYLGEERRAKPGPASVIMNNLPQTGGITGSWAILANMSFGTVIAGLCIFMYRDMSSGVRYNQDLFEKRMEKQQELFREESRSQREMFTQANQSLVTEMRALTAVNQAVLRSVERAERSIQSASPPPRCDGDAATDEPADAQP